MNDNLNSVEVQKILVNPLGEWRYLMRKTPPQECSWPRSSTLLCWWCCHGFTNVPSFLPVSVDMNNDQGIVFTGNFCSWNCTKRYALMLEEKGKVPNGCFYIGLLAYVTVCKGDPCEGGESHELGLCDCIDTYQGVTSVPSREMLQSFGGTMTIDEYRKGFHVITDYDKVTRCFDKEVLKTLKNQVMRCQNSKFWGFRYLHYKGPDVSYTTHVNILPLTNRTFDKKTLVTTGQESLHQAQKLDNGSQQPRSTRRNTQPRNQRISRRGLQHNPHQSLSNADSLAAAPSASVPAPAAPPLPKPIMTQEQSLACNDEQHFYTNSLRGFGNILESMGIQVQRPSSS